MIIKELKAYLEDKGLPDFRLKQIIKALYADGIGDYDSISVLPQGLRQELKAELPIFSFSPGKILRGRQDRTFKALLKLGDGENIETVLLLQPDGDWSVCVSSQVGCSLGCRFCATGKLGFRRNLSYEEISDQVLFWKTFLVGKKMKGRLSHVVYMGMGEPFLNYDNVKRSITLLLDPGLFNLSARHISVSTSGIPDGIRRFSREFPQLNLAVSLISANEKIRSKLMPINKQYPLAEVSAAINDYFKNANRKVFLEYILLSEVNDSQDEADKLIDFIKKSKAPELLHVNLIRYNTVASEYKSSDREMSERFKGYLEKKHVSVTIRRSLGDEIKGACGQLAGDKQ